MHLNHERAWTRIVAILPLGMVVYAGVLLADQKFRPISDYVGEPPRAQIGSFHSEHEEKAESRAEKVESEEEAIGEAAGEVDSPEPAPHESPAPAPEKATEAPAAGGSGADSEWK